MATRFLKHRAFGIRILVWLARALSGSAAISAETRSWNLCAAGRSNDRPQYLRLRVRAVINRRYSGILGHDIVRYYAPAFEDEGASHRGTIKEKALQLAQNRTT